MTTQAEPVRDGRETGGSRAPMLAGDAPMTDQTLIYLGDDVKALGTNKVGGYLIRFGSVSDHDRQGDYFSPTTYIGRAVKAGTDILYHHGLGRVDAIAAKLGNRIIGDGSLTLKDEGWWIEATLDDADPEVKAVLDLANAGKLAWSSGSTDRMVKRKDVKAGVREVLSWPIAEASLSPRAVDPRNKAICIKALLDDEPTGDAADSESPTATTTHDAEKPTDLKGALDGYPTTGAVNAALERLHSHMLGRLDGCMNKRVPKAGVPAPAYGMMVQEYELAPMDDRLRECAELIGDYRDKAVRLVSAMLENDAATVKAILDGGVADAALPSLVDRTKALVADVEVLVPLFVKAADQRHAAGRDLSAEKRQAIKALADAMAELHRQTAPSPDPELLATVRRKLLKSRI
ncbi:MAG: hypothetical protein AB7G11_02665 [Phycisphaerales bacterium]